MNKKDFLGLFLITLFVIDGYGQSAKISSERCFEGSFQSLEAKRRDRDNWKPLNGEKLNYGGIVYSNDEKKLRDSAMVFVIDALLGSLESRCSAPVVNAIKRNASDYVELPPDYWEGIRKSPRKHRSTRGMYMLGIEKVRVNMDALQDLFDCMCKEMQKNNILVVYDAVEAINPGTKALLQHTVDKMEAMLTQDKYRLTVKTGFISGCTELSEYSSNREKLDFYSCINKQFNLNPDIVVVVRNIKTVSFEERDNKVMTEISMMVDYFNTKTFTYVAKQYYTGKASQPASSATVISVKELAINEALNKSEGIIFSQFTGQMYNYVRSGLETFIRLDPGLNDNFFDQLYRVIRTSDYFMPGKTTNEDREENGQLIRWLQTRTFVPCDCSPADLTFYLRTLVKNIKSDATVLRDGNVFLIK